MFDAFVRKFIMVIFAALVAASLLWAYQTFVARAIYESGDGWRDIYKTTPAPRR